MATIYKDAKNADWKTNPEAYQIEKFIVTNNNNLNIHLANGGGTAISLTPVTASINTKNIKTLRK